MMAQTPIDEVHALQIQAGTLGRNAGHKFEYAITRKINELRYPFAVSDPGIGHVFKGEPASLLLQYLGTRENIRNITSAVAISTGALATSEQGKKWLSINGAKVSRCKSDLVITLSSKTSRDRTIGVSTKQCDNRTPTNAQLYFTTAIAFAGLLRSNRIVVSDTAVRSLRQFCGDKGFRPCDNSRLRGRVSDPRHYFWEEIDKAGRTEWERILTKHQNKISRLLFQKAYLNDRFSPDYLIHKTKRAKSWSATEVAIYSIKELVALSRAKRSFETKPYSVRKGSHRDPPGVAHLAPRFGIIQMQRAGQKVHPEQLQFNLEAGYFYKLP
jgi:hypothetical protein